VFSLCSVRSATRQIEHTLAFVFCLYTTSIFYTAVVPTTRAKSAPAHAAVRRPRPRSGCLFSLRSVRAATRRIGQSDTLSLVSHVYVVNAGRYPTQFVATTRAQPAHAAVDPTERLLDLLALRSRCNAANRMYTLRFCLYTTGDWFIFSILFAVCHDSA